MPDYMENVFERAEILFKNIKDQLNWLSGFERPKRGETKYTKDALKVRDELLESISISEEVKSVNTLEELGPLQSRALKIKYRQDVAIASINERTRILKGEAEELATTIKSTSSLSEFELATERLRELAPSKLGGIKSGFTRRVPRAFREFQEQIESGEFDK